MQVNKHGIPVQHKRSRRRREKPNFRLKQRTLITTVDGIEVTAVLADFAPVIKLLKSSGWREAVEVTG